MVSDRGGPRPAPVKLARSPDVEQRLEQPRVQAFLRKGRAFGQQADGIMAVQAFLMAGQHTEIADARIALEHGAERACRILDRKSVV